MWDVSGEIKYACPRKKKNVVGSYTENTYINTLVLGPGSFLMI